jgi:site-specific recombinase XerD
MATYKVVLKKVNKKGEAPVYITFYIDRKKMEIPVRISISPKDFDKKKGYVKQSHEFYQDKNLLISNLKAKINNVFVKYRLKDKTLTVDQFWSEFHNPADFKDFFDFCKHYQRLRFQELAEGTQRHHKSCLGILRKFKNTIHFDELETDLFRRFVLYLRNERGNSEVTIRKTLKSINVYLNEAVRLEYIKENPMNNVKLRGCQETTAIALDESELSALVELYRKRIFAGSKQDVLEFFLFMCFTSLHIGDARELQIDQINNGQLTYMRKKLRNIRPKYIHIPLSEPAMQIIKRNIGFRKVGKIFQDLISDVKVNLYLKEIAQVAGIKKKLSAKVGRHTFATLFLKETRDLNTLKELLGHSNIKQTLIYAHVLDEDRRKGIETFNKFAI